MSRAQLTSTVEQNTGGAVSPYVAGKNKIINGDFNIWQRGAGPFTSFGNYTADRFQMGGDGGSSSVTQQTFTPGTAPVSGYEGQYFIRMVTTVSGSNNLYMIQRVEDVRTFANQTVTLSYWAKCASGTVTSTPLFVQSFGSGGSGAVVFNASNSATITTSWQRFTHTLSVPSIAGKTVGTGSYLEAQIIRFASSATVDLWGVQMEAGSVATAFQTATGTLSGELEACQRYFYASTVSNIWGGNTVSSSTYYTTIAYKVTMRAQPTLAFVSVGSNSFASGAPTISDSKASEAWVGNVANGAANGAYYQFSYTASAEL